MSSFYSISMSYTSEVDGEQCLKQFAQNPYALTVADVLSSTGQQVCKVTTTPTQMFVSPSVMPASHATIILRNIGDYPVRTVSSSGDEILLNANGGLFVGFWGDCNSLYSVGGTSYVVIYTGA